MLRRAPGVAQFATVASAVAAMLAAQSQATISMTSAGVPSTSGVLSVTAGVPTDSPEITTPGVAQFDPHVTTANLTASALQTLTTSGQYGFPNSFTDGCFGYYDGTTGFDFPSPGGDPGAIGRSGLSILGVLNYLGTYAQIPTTFNSITAGPATTQYLPHITTATLTASATPLVTTGSAFFSDRAVSLAAYGYGSGTGSTDLTHLGPFGSLGNSLLKILGTVQTISLFFSNGTPFFQVVITGASAAPAKASFTTVSWTDTNGAESVSTSSGCTYTTSGNTSTWEWAYPHNPSTDVLNSSTTFTFAGVYGANGFNSNAGGFSNGGSSTVTSLGSTGTLVSAYYSFGYLVNRWYFTIGITGASSAPASNAISTVLDGLGNTFSSSSGASYTTSVHTAYWTWEGASSTPPYTTPTVYDITINASGANYAGFDDGTNAGGEGLPAFGSCTNTALTSVGTLNGWRVYYDGTNTNFAVIVTGASSRPSATALYQFQLEPNGAIYLTSNATSTTSGSFTRIWTWLLGSGNIVGNYISSGNTYSLGFSAAPILSFQVQITGAASAPAQNSFGAVTFTDNNGAHNFTEGAATYSTSGNTATWLWSYAYGAYNTNPIANGVVFTFTTVLAAVGFDTGTSGTGFSSGGSSTVTNFGGLGTLVSWTYNWDYLNSTWDFEVAITGASVAPALAAIATILDKAGGTTWSTSSGANYSVVSKTAYYSWKGTSTNPYTATNVYNGVVTLGQTPTGYDDGTNAGGQGYPAFGAISTQTLSGLGTLNAFYYTYNATSNSTSVTAIITGASTHPAKSAFFSVQPGSGTIYNTSASTYSTFGSKASLWTWTVGTGNLIPNLTNTNINFNLGTSAGYDDGTAAGGDALPAIGSLSGTLTLGTVNSVAYYISGGNYFFQLIVTGSVSTPAANAITSVSFKDNTGTNRTFNESAATYTNPTGHVAIWTWSAPTAALGFTGGTVYSVTVLTSTQLWCGFDDGTVTPQGEGSAYGTLASATSTPIGTVNALEYTAIGASPASTTYFILIITGASTAPNQYAFTSISFTGAQGAVNLVPANASYSTNGLAAIWQWQTSSGTPALGFVKGSAYTITVNLPTYSGYDDGTGASGSGFPAFGTLESGNPLSIGTINAIEVDSVLAGGTWTSTLRIAVTGTGAPPAQTALESVAYTNSAGVTRAFVGTAASSFTQNGNTGIWLWVIGTGLTAPDPEFLNAVQYTVSFTLASATPTQVPTRGMHKMQGVLYAVIGPTLYSVSSTGVMTQIATGVGGAGFVRMADNTECLTILVPNTTTCYTYCPNDTSGNQKFRQLVDPTFVQNGAIDVKYCQGFMCFLMANGRGMLNDDGLASSGTGQITFNDGNVFGRENGTDLLVGIEVDHLEVMVFGTDTSEGFLNAGVSPGDPFQAAPSSFIEQGCDPAAGFTVAKQDQTIMWLANDRTVRRRVGQTPVRISNSGIEAILEDADLTGCYAVTPTVAGHPMYVILIPQIGRGIAFDCLTNQWWEPFSLNNNGLWRVLCYANAFGKQLVGDSQSAQIGYLDTKTYTEYGQPLFTEFTTNALYSNNDRFTTRRVELVVSTGQQLTPATMPKITLYISDDSGATYYAREADSVGQTGQRTLRCVWFNLGQSRCRVLKWRISDPTPTFAVQATAVLSGGRW